MKYEEVNKGKGEVRWVMHKRKEADKEEHYAGDTLDNIEPNSELNWTGLIHGFVANDYLSKYSTIVWFQYDFILLPNLPDLKISNMFDIYDSMSGCVCWKSCCSQWERADRKASAILRSIFFTFFLFFRAKHNTSQDNQLRMLIFLHIGFSTAVQFNHVSICEISSLWNQHFGIITTNGRCVWYRVLDKLSRVCFRGIRLLWNRLRSVDSHVFLESVKTVYSVASSRQQTDRTGWKEGSERWKREV